MSRKTIQLGISLVAVASITLGMANPALADFSTTPDSTWMTNGTVYAVIQSGNTIYVGGKFTSLRACPPGTSCPGGVIHTSGVGAIDATTGVGIKTFSTSVSGGSGTVYALAVMNGRLYVGGNFDTFDGSARLNIAAVDPSSGALDTTVDHQVGTSTSDWLRGMAATSDHLYIAGSFAQVDGARRAHLAAFNSDGSLDTTWRPKTSAYTRTLTISCDGQVIAGGAFRTAAGTGGTLQDRATLAMFDPTTGALDAWSPPNADIPGGINAFDLSATCSRLFVGYGGANAIYAFDLTVNPGTILWSSKTGGNVQTVYTDGTDVYFGGHFANVSLVGSSGNASRDKFAEMDLDGAIQPWNPSFDGKFYGPWDILATGSQVWVGGAFTSVSGTAQYMIARFTNQ